MLRQRSEVRNLRAAGINGPAPKLFAGHFVALARFLKGFPRLQMTIKCQPRSPEEYRGHLRSTKMRTGLRSSNRQAAAAAAAAASSTTNKISSSTPSALQAASTSFHLVVIKSSLLWRQPKNAFDFLPKFSFQQPPGLGAATPEEQSSQENLMHLFSGIPPALGNSNLLNPSSTCLEEVMVPRL